MSRALLLAGLAAVSALVLFLRSTDSGCRALLALPERRASAAGAEPLATPVAAPAVAQRAARAERAAVDPAVEPCSRLRVLEAESGLPLAGATVLWRAGGGQDGPARREACDPDGRWQGDAQPAGPVVVDAPGRVPRDVRALLAADRELEVRLFRAAERDVVLRVTSAAGEPVAGATIALGAGDAPRAPCTDAAGEVRVRCSGGVPSLRLAGRVEASGFLQRRFSALDPGTGELRVWNEGLREERTTIVLDRPASAHGTVAEPGGAPLGDVRITVRTPGSSGCEAGASETRAETRTDAGGRYVLDGLPAGRELEWTLVRGARTATRVVTLSGDEPLDWTLE